MVSVLALNKLELKEMINAEIVENPVLEELESNVPLLDELAGKEADRERVEAADQQVTEGEKKDPFDEIDFGTYFKDYLDPGYRSPNSSETSERPSFENFLSKPGTLTDHLMWQLGAIHLSDAVRAAAELVIGNLNDDGYLVASDEELMAAARGENLEMMGIGEISANGASAAAPSPELERNPTQFEADSTDQSLDSEPVLVPSYAAGEPEAGFAGERVSTAPTSIAAPLAIPIRELTSEQTPFTLEELREGIEVVRQMDPVGVAARDLRECLLLQLRELETQANARVVNGNAESCNRQLQQVQDSVAIVDTQLRNVQNRQYKDIARGIGRPLEAVMEALDFVKTLDPKPGQRYNQVEPKLIEPDVAFVKQGDDYVVMMNEDDIPVLRLNPGYKKLLNRDAAERDVRNYVKERYKSAIQLMKNIEQRKQTIMKVCQSIVRRQTEFLGHGLDHLKPMMIKEVAEEVGVHPSTVSRAVANKYVHTPQGVFELRYFFSEAVQGPMGGATPLLLLKRKVKKMIEDEDRSRPLTDEQITTMLQAEGINVTRRTVAKYREDMKIPSTHQRRIRN
jgi:RNA polymerase sigma-54 factor